MESAPPIGLLFVALNARIHLAVPLDVGVVQAGERGDCRRKIMSQVWIEYVD